MKWFNNLFSTSVKPSNMSDMYWHKEPALVRDAVGKYDELPLGWIYNGLFAHNDYLVPHRKHRIGKGWYRNQIAIL